MSHFPCIVVADDHEAALQPFHEYECTGVRDEHVVFVDEHDTVLADWTEPTAVWRAADGTIYDRHDDRFYREFTPAEQAKHGRRALGMGFGGGLFWHSKDWGDGRGYRAKVHMDDDAIVAAGYVAAERARSEDPAWGGSINRFASEYHGYGEVRDGRCGRLTNPNAKWDWWVVGGRWSGWLGRDEGLRRTFDLELVRVEAFVKAGVEFDRVVSATRGIDLPPWTWDELREKHRTAGNAIELARTEWHAHPWNRAVREMARSPFGWSADDVSIVRNGRDAHQRAERARATAPHAWLVDGKWIERGEMGWFATVHDERDRDDWNAACDLLWAEIDPEAMIRVVDCHI